MANVRLRAKKITETYHMFIHLLLGVIVALVAHRYFPEVATSRLILAGFLGSFLPDIDHIAFMYLYGKNSSYAKMSKHVLSHDGFRAWWTFCTLNHKKNTQLFSHNILFALSAILISLWFLIAKDSISMFVFMFAWFMHYIFDIFEDYLFFGKLNSNWTLKFKETYK